MADFNVHCSTTYVLGVCHTEINENQCKKEYKNHFTLLI